MLKAAIRDPNPVVFLENEILYGRAFEVSDEVMDKNYVAEVGKVLRVFLDKRLSKEF